MAKASAAVHLVWLSRPFVILVNDRACQPRPARTLADAAMGPKPMAPRRGEGSFPTRQPEWHWIQTDLLVWKRRVRVAWGTYAKPHRPHPSPGRLLTWFGSWNHLVERIIHSESHTAGTCITAASCILICSRGYHPNGYLYIMYAV